MQEVVFTTSRLEGIFNLNLWFNQRPRRSQSLVWINVVNRLGDCHESGLTSCNQMRIDNNQLQLSATDVAKHLACRHLTSLDMLAAFKKIERPYGHDPGVAVLEE